MFGNIKRVISDPEELGSKEGKISKTEVLAETMNEASAAAAMHQDADAKNLVNDDRQPITNEEEEQKAEGTSSLPAVVECDDRVETDGVVAVMRNLNSSVSTASSVSDHSSDGGGEHGEAGDDGEGVDTPREMPPAAILRYENPLSRPDSQVSTGSSVSSIRTGGAASSRDASGNWGWFEDVHGADGSSTQTLGKDDNKKTNTRTKKAGTLQHYAGVEPLNDAAMAVTAPTYVLEESRSSQKLWKDTAGTRPPQPVEERAFYEKMWAQNFERSQVKYKMPYEVLIASSPISLSPFADGNFDEGADGGRSELSNYNLASGGDGSTTGKDPHLATATLIDRMNDSTRPTKNSSKEGVGTRHNLVKNKVKTVDGDLTVLIRGDNVFGTTVSKSFARTDESGGASVVDTVNISIASYRVVESKKDGKFAQFLVIYREGSIRDTLGVWKRYSDFVELSHLVTASHEGCSSVLANMSPLAITEEQEVEHLPNAITSWRLLKKRQRWYRCLDAGYLSLKVFLLERFLHDILFESSSPKILRDFALGTG